MGGPTDKGKGLNFLPYLVSNNSKTGKQIKLLIDTGANKNILRPGIIPTKFLEKVNQTITNISEVGKIERKCKANFLGEKFPPQTFYIFKFHDFFDGIIGTETIAEMEGNINFPNSTLTLNNVPFKFQKFYLTKRPREHIVTCHTQIDGDWLISQPKKLADDLILLPGLYRSEEKQAKIAVVTSDGHPPRRKFSLGVKINNFELNPPIKPDHIFSEEEISSLIRTNHLSEFEKVKLVELLKEKQQLLLKPGEKLTCINGAEHTINTIDDKPIFTKSYRYPHHFKGDVEAQVKEMLADGIIQHSTSPFNSPVWVVPKKMDASGKRKVRVVIDFRKLNDKTVEDKYPIPQIDEILDNLGKSAYFTTLDMKSGFHQILMSLKDRYKTAFSTSSGHYEFTRMPFGLKNAPATFQRVMNNVLAGLVGRICFVYLDDIIIFGHSLDNHLKNLEKVFDRLTHHNLKIQLDKCEFLQREIGFLGHIVTQDGVKPNPETVQKILDWPLPKTQKQIKQFLGLTGYYRKFIKDYSKLTKPMSKYMKQDVALDLRDPEYIKSFESLKRIITSDQVLAYPDFTLPFILTTDASDYALGAVLSQIQNGVDRPISFASRTLSDRESGYATNEKEALAIIWSVKKFTPYLFGKKFTLVTDHKPLTFIKTSDKNPKILRWRLDLEAFDYDIVYKEGKTNVVADALSRIKIDEKYDDTPVIHTHTIPLITQPSTSDTNQAVQSESDADTIHSADTSDDHFLHISERPINYYRNQIVFKISPIETEVLETPFTGYRRITILKNNFSKEDITNYLLKYHNGKQTALFAPESIQQIIQESYRENFSQKGHFVFTASMVEDVTVQERQDCLISKEHERAHRGINEVESQLKRSYFFPKMNTRIKSYINGCRTCYQHKYDRKPYNIKISPRPIMDKPFDRVHMDIFIINKQSFLSIIDSFSKHLQMFPLKTKNLPDVRNALTKYITTFGPPALIVTDHETTFVSTQLREFLSAFDTQLEYASSSESNGQIEKTHATIIEIYNTNKNKFRSLTSKTLIRASVALYNNSVHSTTKFTPNEIIFNYSNFRTRDQLDEQAEKLFDEVKVNASQKHNVQAKLNLQRENPPEIKENQEVFLKPNIRTKTQPRGQEVTAQEVQLKTFKNKKGTKRNKNKIKRIKK